MTVTITINGGLTAAPELRYSQSGIAIANGTVASTDRYLDRQTNEWKDGKRLFLRWSAFKELAENIAASQLDKGAQVSITGKLHTREYEDREGQKRSSTELEVSDFSVSLKKATVQVTRAQSTQGGRAPAPASDEPSWPVAGFDGDSPF
jgi:single-strand DNA-binding protein